MAQLPLSVAVAHRHAIADQRVKGLVVLQQRARKIVMGEFGNGFFNGRRRQLRIELDQRSAQVAHQNRVALVAAAQCAVWAKGFLIPQIEAVPAQHRFQMLGKGGLHQSIFAIDVGVGH